MTALARECRRRVARLDTGVKAIFMATSSGKWEQRRGFWPPHLVATFHPELTNDASIHRLFLDKIEARG